MVAGGPAGESEELGAARIAQTIIHLDTSFSIRAMGVDSAEDRDLREWIAARGQARDELRWMGRISVWTLDPRQLRWQR